MSRSGNVSSYEKPYYTSSLYGGNGGGGVVTLYWARYDKVKCIQVDLLQSPDFVHKNIYIKIYGEPHNHILEPF